MRTECSRAWACVHLGDLSACPCHFLLSDKSKPRAFRGCGFSWCQYLLWIYHGHRLHAHTQPQGRRLIVGAAAAVPRSELIGVVVRTPGSGRACPNVNECCTKVGAPRLVQAALETDEACVPAPVALKPPSPQAERVGVNAYRQATGGHQTRAGCRRCMHRGVIAGVWHHMTLVQGSLPNRSLPTMDGRRPCLEVVGGSRAAGPPWRPAQKPCTRVRVDRACLRAGLWV